MACDEILVPGSGVGAHELSILMGSADQVRGSEPRAAELTRWGLTSP